MLIVVGGGGGSSSSKSNDELEWREGRVMAFGVDACKVRAEIRKKMNIMERMSGRITAFKVFPDLHHARSHNHGPIRALLPSPGPQPPQTALVFSLIPCTPLLCAFSDSTLSQSSVAFPRLQKQARAVPVT